MPRPCQARDDSIYWDRVRGATLSSLAEKYGLSPERVRQIWIRGDRDRTARRILQERAWLKSQGLGFIDGRDVAASMLDYVEMVGLQRKSEEYWSRVVEPERERMRLRDRLRSLGRPP
jgi:hypothetical protein